MDVLHGQYGRKGALFARSLSPIVPHAAYRFVETAVTVRPAHAPHDNPVVAKVSVTLGRRHSWLASEGFSLSAANADVQKLLATLYH